MPLALFLAAATIVGAPACSDTTLHSVLRDRDRTQPLLVAAASGLAWRPYGSDFIDPRRWQRGDRLSICAATPGAPEVTLTNLTRNEAIPARAATAPGAPDRIQVLAGPAFAGLLDAAATLCPQSTMRWASPAALLDAEESFAAAQPALAGKIAAASPLARCADHDGASCPAIAGLEGIAKVGALPQFTQAACRRKDWK
jgi:hypothetical protein